MLGVMTLMMGYLGIESIGPLTAETGFGSSIGKAAVMITAGTLTWSASPGALAQPRLVERWICRGVANGPARMAILGGCAGAGTRGGASADACAARLGRPSRSR